MVFFVVVVVESIEVEVGHQIGLNEVDGLCQASQELIEVFLVQEHLMAIIATILKTLLALGYRDEIIVSASCAHIEEVSAALASLNTFRKNTVVGTVIGTVGS